MQGRYQNILACVLVTVLMVACRQGSSLTKFETPKASAKSYVSHLSDNDQKRFDYFYLEAIRQGEADHYAAAFDLLRHCLDIDPHSPEVAYAISQYYIALKDTAKAISYMEMASVHDPANNTYSENLAMTYARYKDYDKSIPVYEKLFEENPNRTDVLENLYALYNQKEDYDNMIKTLNRMEVVDGKSERISQAKFRIYLDQDKPKQAFAEMESLANQYPNDLRYRVAIGNLLLENGKEAEALNTFHNVLKQEPDNTMAKMSLMAYFKAQKQDSLYNKLLRQVLINKNTSSEDKFNIMRDVVAENEQNGGDSTKVLSLFKDVQSSSADVDMLSLQASYMVMKKMPNDSISPVFRKILEVAPDNAYARLQLISYAWSKKDHDDVIALCKPALQYNPEEMAFYYYLGVAYYQKEKSNEALDAFQKGISVISPQSDPAIVSDFYAVMGDILHEKGREKEAFAAYDSCLQWKDDNIGCMNNYAYYLSVNGKNLEKAEQMSYKTVKKEPDNSTFLDTYAWILFQQKRYSEAKIYIEQAIQHDSDSSAVVIEHAGDIYAMNKEMDKALFYWNQSLQKGNESKVLFRKIKFKKYIKE